MNIRMIGPGAQRVQLAGARYDLYIPDTKQTFVGCLATAAFADPVTFLATHIVDKDSNFVIE